MRGLFRVSLVAVLLAGVATAGVVSASSKSVIVGGVCVREGARDKVSGKQVVCIANAKKQLRWRVVTATNVKVVSGTTTTSTTVASPSTTVVSTTTSSTSIAPTTTTTTTTATSTTVFGVDRTAPTVTLARSAGSSGVATLRFTVTGNEPIICSTLSAVEGVDFVFTRISRINSITQTVEDICTISAQSTAEPGDTNPRASILTAATTFSITDSAGNIQTSLVGSPQEIWVQRIARPVFSLSATTETANVNSAITGYTITSTGGTIASYSMTGTLPAGLTFSTTTGRITGTPTATQSATVYTITATNASSTATATFTLTVVVTCANGGTCVLGDTGPGGGIVFYVQAAGGTFACGLNLASTCKYLEGAPVGSYTKRSWATDANGNRETLVTGADATAIGSGYQNSVDIVAQTGNVAATSAAVYAREYTNGGKSDWYLPSRDELNQMFVEKSRIDGLGTEGHWSSSEAGANSAIVQYFGAGNTANGNKASSDNGWVRPVRAFG